MKNVAEILKLAEDFYKKAAKLSLNPVVFWDDEINHEDEPVVRAPLSSGILPAPKPSPFRSYKDVMSTVLEDVKGLCDSFMQELSQTKLKGKDKKRALNLYTLSKDCRSLLANLHEKLSNTATSLAEYYDSAVALEDKVDALTVDSDLAINCSSYSELLNRAMNLVNMLENYSHSSPVPVDQSSTTLVG